MLNFDIWRSEDLIGLVSVFLFISYILYKRVHWSVGLSFAYYSLVAVPKFMAPSYFWGTFQLEEIVGFESCVWKAQMFLTIGAILLILIRENSFKLVESFLILTAFIDSILVIFRHDHWALLNNPALDASFIACVLPIAYQRINKNLNQLTWFIMPIFIIPLLITKTSSGILGLGLFLFLILWPNIKSLVALGVIAGIGFMTQGKQLLDSSGRVGVWKLSWDFFMHHESVNRLIGTGAGTFNMYGPGLQMADAIIKNQSFPHFGKAWIGLGTGVINYHSQAGIDLMDKIIRQNTSGGMDGFFWLHNEWMDTLFTTGIIGLSLLLIVYAICLDKAKDAVFQSLVTVGALSFIQPLSKWFIVEILIVFLILKAFRTQALD